MVDDDSAPIATRNPPRTAPVTADGWRPPLAGICSVAAGLAAGELVAAWVSPFASPYQAVAAFLVDHAPAPVREFAINTFGLGDKAALMIGMAFVVIVIAAGAGVAQRRRPPLGVLIVVAFAACGVAAALTRPTAGASYALPSIIAGIVAAALLTLLAGARACSAPETSTATAATPDGWSRRGFLGAVGLVVVASAGMTIAARRIAKASATAADRLRSLPLASSPAPAIPPGADLDLDGATSFTTSNNDFYRIDTALSVPQMTSDEWQLRVHGLVDNELTISYDELTSMAARERYVTLTCVSNEVGGDLIGNARWLGYPVAEILARAGVQPGADMLLSTSVDGWTSGTPISALTDGRDALLAIGMNGEPLPVEHGYPVRQVVPGLYGYVSACKWVVDWEITRFQDAQAYWTERGWSAMGPIKTASRIDRPTPLSENPAGAIVVAGTAWAQHRGISKVEVRVDDGPWQEAQLTPEYSIDTWRQWSWTWQATAGQHTLYCRATDADGKTQTEDRADPVPDGATGWHSRVLQVT